MKKAGLRIICILLCTVLLFMCGGVRYARGEESLPVWPVGDGLLHDGIEEGIDAKSYCLMEMNTRRVLLARNENNPLPIASTTKIMSALLAVKSAGLDEVFTVDRDAIYVEGTSMGLLPEYQVTLRGLAVGMLLKSGNDAANAAAVRIAGSIEAFVARMNEEAAVIGMANTKFATPSGLDYGDPYSCAYDMALLASHALKQPEFAEICSQKSCSVMVGNPPITIKIPGHNRMLDEYEGAIGVKTGFTKKAGRCLVSAATRDGVTLICVTLGAADDYNVHKKMLDFGFSKLQRVSLDINDAPQSVPVANGTADQVNIAVQQQDIALLPGESGGIEKEIAVRSLSAPVYENQIVGEILYRYQGRVVASAPVYAQQTVYLKPEQSHKGGFWNWLTGLFKKDPS